MSRAGLDVQAPGKPPNGFVMVMVGFVFKPQTFVFDKFYGLFRQKTREPLRHQDDSRSDLCAKVRLAWFHFAFRGPSGEPGRDMNSKGGPVHVAAGRVDALVVEVWE